MQIMEGSVRFFLILFLIEKVAIAQSVPHAARRLIATPAIAAEDRLGGGIDELIGLGTWGSVAVDQLTGLETSELVAFGT